MTSRILQLDELVDSQVLIAAVHTSVEHAIAQLQKAAYGHLMVVESFENPRFLGVFGDREVVQLVAANRDLHQLAVQPVMRSLSPLYLADLGDCASVLAHFQHQASAVLPVVDHEGIPVGWLPCYKVLQALQFNSNQDHVCKPSTFKKTDADAAHNQAEMALRRQLNRALLLQKVTDAIRSQLDPQQIFEATVTQVGQAFKVDRCLLLTYKTEPQPQFLVAAEYVEPGDTPLALRALFFKKNAYAAQVLSQDQAVVSSNVYADRLLQPMESLCQQFGLKSMLTVRTSYQGEPNGALVLHQCDHFRTWSSGEIQLLEAIAAQVGIALAQVRLLDQEKAQRMAIDQQNARLKQEIQKRKRAEVALSRSNAALQAQQEAALDGILMVDENRQVVSFNHRFCELWKIPPERMGRSTSPELLQRILDQLERPKFFLNQVEYLYAHPDEISHEEVPLKNNRVLERYSAPVTSSTGEFYGRVWFFRDISERKQAERQLEQRQRYLAVLVEIQRHLLAYNAAHSTYTSVLKELGQTCGADRVYLFENHTNEMGVLLTSQRAEWCAPGIQPQLANPSLQNLPYDDFCPRWAEVLSQGGIINGLVRDFPAVERAVLEPQGIQSILVLPLLVNQTFWGLIGFDHCTAARQWTTAEVSLLSVAASAISLYQERQQAEASLKQSIERERATLRVVEQMRQTLNLDQIFAATVRELRQLLKCDRVVIFRFNEDWSGEVVAESCAAWWQPLMQSTSENFSLPQELCNSDHCQLKSWGPLYSASASLHLNPGPPWVETQYTRVNNVDTANLALPYLNFLNQLQAKAALIVPIYLGNSLWGLLGCYQNAHARNWSDSESNLVMHISTQLAIALHQAVLFNQTQQQSVALEKAKDAAEAASRAKSEFLTNISHELRTPLNAILGFTQVMSHDVSNSKHRDYINIINRSGQHLLKLINDVLEMSKIEAGRCRLNPTSFNFYQLLDTLYEMLLLKAQVKHLTLAFEIAPDIPQLLTTDEGKLRQILLNLLGNAIKFTQHGTVTLRVWVNREILSAPVPCTLHFEVEDTGLGIAPEEMADLFTPFVQAYAGAHTSEGTGLGLAISQKFVQLMGGAIAVESTVGQGSCFRFGITVVTAAPQSFAAVSPARRVVSLELGQPEYRILIVEDHWENQRLLVEFLQPVGFEVQVVANGAEGIDVWQSWQPHLILMDIRMPIMDGYTATRQIRVLEHQRGWDPPQRIAQNMTFQTTNNDTNSSLPTKIIAITSNAFEEERAAILSAGCDDFISKPFQEEVIFAKLAEHLNVRYTYSNSPKSNIHQNISSQERSELNLESLRKMPPAWLYKLNQAAIQGRDESILELTQLIPETDFELAEKLEKLARSFQFEKIIDLLSQLSLTMNCSLQPD